MTQSPKMAINGAKIARFAETKRVDGKTKRRKLKGHDRPSRDATAPTATFGHC